MVQQRQAQEEHGGVQSSERMCDTVAGGAGACGMAEGHARCATSGCLRIGQYYDFLFSI